MRLGCTKNPELEEPGGCLFSAQPNADIILWSWPFLRPGQPANKLYILFQQGQFSIYQVMGIMLEKLVTTRKLEVTPNWGCPVIFVTFGDQYLQNISLCG